VAGTVSNLAFLALIGVIAEQVLSRPQWLALYLAGGAAGELAGYAWQPVGAGNSVAVCGLAGALAVLMLRGDPGLPPAAPYAQLLWAGALVATVSVIPAVAIFAVTAPAVRLLRARGWPAERVAGGAVLACGIALAAAENIHGVALLAGALLSLAVVAVVPADTGRPGCRRLSVTGPEHKDGGCADGLAPVVRVRLLPPGR